VPQPATFAWSAPERTGRAGLGQLELLDPVIARATLHGEGRIVRRLAPNRLVLQEVQVLTEGGRPARKTYSSVGAWSDAAVAFKNLALLKVPTSGGEIPPRH